MYVVFVCVHPYNNENCQKSVKGPLNICVTVFNTLSWCYWLLSIHRGSECYRERKGKRERERENGREWEQQHTHPHPHLFVIPESLKAILWICNAWMNNSHLKSFVWFLVSFSFPSLLLPVWLEDIALYVFGCFCLRCRFVIVYCWIWQFHFH